MENPLLSQIMWVNFIYCFNTTDIISIKLITSVIYGKSNVKEITHIDKNVRYSNEHLNIRLTYDSCSSGNIQNAFVPNSHWQN